VVKIVGELEGSLKKYLPIKADTPDSYAPPNSSGKGTSLETDHSP